MAPKYMATDCRGAPGPMLSSARIPNTSASRSSSTHRREANKFHEELEALVTFEKASHLFHRTLMRAAKFRFDPA